MNSIFKYPSLFDTSSEFQGTEIRIWDEYECLCRYAMEAQYANTQSHGSSDLIRLHTCSITYEVDLD